MEVMMIAYWYTLLILGLVIVGGALSIDWNPMRKGD